jgi:hypothetical protein
LEHALVSAVLLDHAKDWADDLVAGRYNVFVDYASPHPQTERTRDQNRRQVLEELCLGDAARPYFDAMRKHLQLAIEQAQAIDCPELTQYLQSFDTDVLTLSERLGDEAKAWLSEITDRLFGLSPQADEPATSEERR